MNKKGFTLIELLAVIIILGILMIIAIPSVTRYISDSRKSVYVDTANSLISGARNMVNEGKLQMFDTDTTYYIAAECIKTEGANKSPYGEFVKAYVVVTYNGKGYEYYWTSVDEVGNGIKKITRVDKLTEESVESDLNTNDIKDTVGIDGRSQYMIIDKEHTDCGAGSKNSVNGLFSGETGEEDTTGATIISIKPNIAEVADAKRYVGNEANNFVKFNGNELWRIIGIYNGKMKIIRYNSITNMKFNEVDNHQNYWDGSDIEVYLNGTYYESLNTTAKNMITEGTWYVGMVKDDDTRALSYEHSKAITWNGKVGLLAPYEFLYASTADGCDNVAQNKYYNGCGDSSVDWLDFRSCCKLISPHFSHNWSYFDGTISGNTGGFLFGDSVQNARNVYPVVYLKPSVNIISGTGSYGDPYILE